MSTVTQIAVVSIPGSEPAPARRRAQRLRSSDGRAAITTVSALTYADEATAVREVANVELLRPVQLICISA